jgi:hypothetical protein
MNNYQKIALIVIRAEAVFMILYALREFFSIALYVPAVYFSIFPRFYLNIGGTVYWGFLNFFAGLFILAISKPIAGFIADRLEDEE